MFAATRVTRALPVLSALLLLGTTLGSAAELAGTSWNLTGNSKLKVRGSGRDRQLVGAVLTFNDAANCSLAINDQAGAPLATIPCTWSSPSAESKRFDVDLDDAALNEALTTLVTDLTALPPGDVTVGVDTERGRGTYNANKQRINIDMKVKGSATSESQQSEQRFNLKLKLKGDPVPVG
ncbi:MAG: hypothetical protein KBD01_09230 [Acidobacteria bacterium]|nr:hypothetical protein [Acidobacteriota bacterium]